MSSLGLRAPGSRRERGSAFIVAMGVMLALVVLIAGLVTSNVAATRGQWDRMQERRAKLMAEAGIQRALAQLQGMDTGHAMFSDKWAALGGKNASTEYVVGLDSFRIQIVDAGSRINLNTVDEDYLKKLPLSSEQVASLLDWRDTTGKAARPEGAKDEYYNHLSHPYNAKLQTLSSVDELLLIRGFSPSTLYAPNSLLPNSARLNDLLTVDSLSADRDPNGNPKLDLNSCTPQQLYAVGVIPSVVTVIFNARGAFNTLGDVFKLPGMTKEAAQVLADYATVGTASSNTGLININTASEAVLDTIPNMDPDIAQSILDRQETGFKGLGELGNVPGVDLPTYAAIINRFCVGSRSFTVRVIGTAGSTRVAMEAILTFDDKGKVSVSREQPVLAGDVRSRWGWATMTANQEVVAEPW